jgi:phage pi2 protein 07
MAATIITMEDLIAFKEELFSELKELLQVKSSTQTENWIKTPELKKMLKISHGTLQHLRINGTIPYTKIGGTIYYDKNDIEKLIQANKFNNSLSK